MKIAGFNINKKVLIVVGVVILVIIISSSIKSKKEEQELEERASINAERLNNELNNSSNTSSKDTDFNAQLQAKLVEKYGTPPDGFEWDELGNLIALGNSDLNAEEVMYSYIRALSILDFSTAQSMSTDSVVYEEYSDYYSENNISDYYSDFLRKQFKESLTSIEILNVTDEAVLADGTKYFTININVLDLTDKNFWEKDRNEIFETLRVYNETEEDSVKADKYVYDYVYNSYVNGSIGKKQVTIELVVGKSAGGNWLVTNDNELYKVLSYENGMDVAKYILSEYSNWYREKKQEEAFQNLN